MMLEDSKAIAPALILREHARCVLVGDGREGYSPMRAHRPSNLQARLVSGNG